MGAFRQGGSPDVWEEAVQRCVVRTRPLRSTTTETLPRAYAYRGLTRIFVGQASEAIPALETALRLSPRDPLRNVWEFRICHAHAHMGEWGKAIDWCRKSVATDAGFWIPYLDLAAAYGWLGREAEAKAAVASLHQLMPGYTVQQWGEQHVVRRSAVPARRQATHRRLAQGRPPGRGEEDGFDARAWQRTLDRRIRPSTRKIRASSRALPQGGRAAQTADRSAGYGRRQRARPGYGVAARSFAQLLGRCEVVDEHMDFPVVPYFSDDFCPIAFANRAARSRRVSPVAAAQRHVAHHARTRDGLELFVARLEKRRRRS